jgi:hypothetical protein
VEQDPEHGASAGLSGRDEDTGIHAFGLEFWRWWEDTATRRRHNESAEAGTNLHFGKSDGNDHSQCLECIKRESVRIWCYMDNTRDGVKISSIFLSLNKIYTLVISTRQPMKMGIQHGINAKLLYCWKLCFIGRTRIA